VAKKQSSTEKKAKPSAKSTARPSTKAAKPAATTLFNEPVDEPKAKKAPKKVAAVPVRPLTVEEIGHAAGEIWGALSTGNGGVTVASLKKSVDAPADLVMLALGWLAREDKVAIDASGRTPTISLK
jgi:hypothetical protein